MQKNKIVSSSLNITKTEIKVSSLPLLQRLQKRSNKLKQILGPLWKEQDELSELLFGSNYMRIQHDQLIKLMLDEDWCEPIDVVSGIGWQTEMKQGDKEKIPNIEIKAPVLKDTQKHRYGNVFVVHDGRVWLCGSLEVAYKKVEQIRRYNTLDWQTSFYFDKKLPVDRRIRKIKEQAAQGTVKQLPAKKRKQVA